MQNRICEGKTEKYKEAEMEGEEAKFLPTCWITRAHTRQVLANKNPQVLTLNTHEREQQTL